MSKDVTFHGIIGDMNPIEHIGGVVLDRGDGPEVIYFMGWDYEGETRVTVYQFMVADDVTEELSFADWDKVADCCGYEKEDLVEEGRSENILARASVYETFGAYYGLSEIDCYPREMTLEEAEAEFGDLVDRCHAATSKAATAPEPQEAPLFG